MKKTLDVAVDIETLSTKSNAAIIEIAAKVFSVEKEHVDICHDFMQVQIDSTSCAMYGMDFSKDTVNWWRGIGSDLKKKFENGRGIGVKEALSLLRSFIDGHRVSLKADEICIWSQGSFDSTILKNAYTVVFGGDESEIVPWKYSQVRDARTYILEGIRLICPQCDDPYKAIPAMEDWEMHSALSDCDNLIHNVQFIYQTLNKN